MSTLFIVGSNVYEKATDKESSEQRLYISSLPANAKALNFKTRCHWGVENSLHYVLNVTFGEDAARKRKNYEADNFNSILKTVMTLLATNKTKKLSQKNKRFKAALDHKYREKIVSTLNAVAVLYKSNLIYYCQ